VENKTVISSGALFIPISPLLRDDADVTLVFLSGNGVIHSAPSADDWYRVSPTTVNVSATINGIVDTTAIYLPLEPASPLGCVNQYQFCHRDIQHCGPLASLWDAYLNAAHLFNTTDPYKHASSTSGDPFRYFMAGFLEFQSANLAEMLGQLGPASLASKSSLTSSLQGPIPSNQWQLDVIRWSDIMKSSLQAAYLGISYFNPPDPSLLEYRTNFTSPDLRKLCNNQVGQP
jgi:hypothetical protein